MTRPLEGKRAVAACSALKAEKLAAGLNELGAEVFIFQAIEVRELTDNASLNSALMKLHEYAWIIFTSVHAVRVVSRRMKALGLEGQRIIHGQICAVGPATAAALREDGFTVALVPKDHAAEGIVEAFAGRPEGLRGVQGKKVLLPRAREARDVLPEALTAAGASVDIIPCYETVIGHPDEKLLSALRGGAPDLLVFTSSSTVTNFIEILGEDAARPVLSKACVAALGPVVAGTLVSFGRKPDILPRTSTIENLLESIAAHFGRKDNF